MMESAMPHFDDLSRKSWDEMLETHFQREADLQQSFLERVMNGQSDEYGGE